MKALCGLDMRLWDQSFGVVERTGLDINQPRQIFLIYIEQSGPAFRAKMPKRLA